MHFVVKLQILLYNHQFLQYCILKLQVSSWLSRIYTIKLKLNSYFYFSYRNSNFFSYKILTFDELKKNYDSKSQLFDTKVRSQGGGTTPLCYCGNINQGGAGPDVMSQK